MQYVTEFVEKDISTIEIQFIKKSDGTPQSGAGLTPKLRYKIGVAAIVTRTMTWFDSPNGIARYTFVANELTPGKMSYEGYVEDGVGGIITSAEVGKVDVRKRLA